jgi:hypothetical protein
LSGREDRRRRRSAIFGVGIAILHLLSSRGWRLVLVEVSGSTAVARTFRSRSSGDTSNTSPGVDLDGRVLRVEGLSMVFGPNSEPFQKSFRPGRGVSAPLPALASVRDQLECRFPPLGLSRLRWRKIACFEERISRAGGRLLRLEWRGPERCSGQSCFRGSMPQRGRGPWAWTLTPSPSSGAVVGQSLPRSSAVDWGGLPCCFGCHHVDRLRRGHSNQGEPLGAASASGIDVGAEAERGGFP